MGVRLDRVALLALVLVVAGAISQARELRDFAHEKSVKWADASRSKLAEYYRTHAKARLGREHRLANGVAWRLLADVRTGAVAPRITWMPDRESMLMANALFEIIHGAEIIDYDRRDLARRHTELYQWEDGYPPYVIKPPYIVQEKVVVTYATSRLVSYVDVTREVREISMGIVVVGTVLDLEQGTINSISNCPGSGYDSSNFRFGELLDVCDDEAYKRFMTLWSDKVRQAIAKARIRGDGRSEECGESMEPLEKERRGLAFYLTPAGLAVFNEDWWPNIAKYCAFYDDLTVNPIILTYQELEPFMKPGPWRDDVLRQGRTMSR
jgi:hypothetical protein